jgi:hypothetical protein
MILDLRFVEREEHAHMLGEFGQPLWEKPVSRTIKVLQKLVGLEDGTAHWVDVGIVDENLINSIEKSAKAH